MSNDAEVKAKASKHRGRGATIPTAHDNTGRQQETHKQTAHTGAYKKYRTGSSINNAITYKMKSQMRS